MASQKRDTKCSPQPIQDPKNPFGTRASPRTVLYIEDNPANMLLVVQLIARRSDLKLLMAVNGYTGIELARQFRPDVIVMDINLPDINGVDALKALLQDPATLHIPVVALSSDAFPKQIERGIQAGFFRYLTKPFQVDEFMDSLDAALLVAVKSQ
jgi:CheY-like chemotaxis protein